MFKTDNNKPKLKHLFKLITKKHRGSTLLEVLVALLIVAIGFLGLASMQLISLKNLNNAQFRTLATAYAYDMAERMRTNRAAVSAGFYDAIDATETDPGCSSCSVEQIAQLDAYQWNQLIGNSIISGGLPTGTGKVESKGGGVFEITVAWREQQQSSSGGKIDNVNFIVRLQL
ncbi:type IV pilus modification protein PilV [Psychromonas hadalis]|uniref:type IV pilus modification protein PilV n=1 Tax=Psychromonas hadalis TaxID=211669 RepID=UPI0003B5D273|nr:type IV pilus modification protein PilV [Psychromonas hadalis]